MDNLFWVEHLLVKMVGEINNKKIQLQTKKNIFSLHPLFFFPKS